MAGVLLATFWCNLTQRIMSVAAAAVAAALKTHLFCEAASYYQTRLSLSNAVSKAAALIRDIPLKRIACVSTQLVLLLLL
jgi:hypothetical protein